MKARGYELFNLNVRRYSTAALPGRYLLPVPAQSELGRPLQGDALYARDLGNPEHEAFAARLGPAKLLNLVCIFAAFDLPDCAAEIALRYRDRLATLCDVDEVLDLLAAQAQGGVDKPFRYTEYMDRFEAEDPMFFPPTPQAPPPPAPAPMVDPPGRRWVRSGLRRLGRAWRALREPPG
jgi:hypothetical protein